MKKASLVAFTLGLIASVGVKAQVSVVPKAGVSLGSYAYRAHTKEDRKYRGPSAGLAAGVGFNIPLRGSNWFSVQPELVYIQKGDRYDNRAQGVGVRFGNTYNFLELPVMAKVTFGNERLKVYLNAGPSFGYALGGRYIIEGEGVYPFSRSGPIRFARKPLAVPSNDPVSYYEPKYHRAFEVAAQFGGGVGIQAGPGVVQFDARYGMGITSLNRESNEPTRRQTADGRSRTFALTLGYAVPLGGQPANK